MTDSPAAPLDEAEFKQELTGVLPQLRAFARGLCGRPDFADDLVQEAMVKAWSNRATFNAGTNFRAWMFAILRNSFLNIVKRNSRQVELEPEKAESMLVARAEQEDGLALADVQSALQKLKPDRREALLLVGAGGFGYAEAAEICDCPIGTMKSRVARGRADLAAILDRQA